MTPASRSPVGDPRLSPSSRATHRGAGVAVSLDLQGGDLQGAHAERVDVRLASPLIHWRRNTAQLDGQIGQIGQWNRWVRPCGRREANMMMIIMMMICVSGRHSYYNRATGGQDADATQQTQRLSYCSENVSRNAAALCKACCQCMS